VSVVYQCKRISQTHSCHGWVRVAIRAHEAKEEDRRTRAQSRASEKSYGEKTMAGSSLESLHVCFLTAGLNELTCA